MIEQLEKIGACLETPVHLLIWDRGESFEVMALKEDEWIDAFPLPLEIQSAAAEGGFILDTKTAAKLDMEQLPEDFWEDLDVVEYCENLTVSSLGRSGRKYLEVYRAVSSGEVEGAFSLREDELLRVTCWLREANLFNHRQGDQLMEVLAQLRK